MYGELAFKAEELYYLGNATTMIVLAGTFTLSKESIVYVEDWSMIDELVEMKKSCEYTGRSNVSSRMNLRGFDYFIAYIINSTLGYIYLIYEQQSSLNFCIWVLI